VERLALTANEADELLASAKTKMVAARSQSETPPVIDQKVITAWNGLAIKGLADAGRLAQRPDWVTLASNCADFVRQYCWDNEQLHNTWHATGPGHAACIDDYANVLIGLESLLQCRWSDDVASFTRELADAALTKFYDNDNGGFCFAPNDIEPLIYQPKPTLDEALPPGNATLALTLHRLGLLFGEQRYMDAAANTLRWARAVMEHLPTGHCGLLSALEDALLVPQAVVLRGPEAEMAVWTAALASTFAPWRSVFAIPYTSAGPLPSFLPRLVSAAAQTTVSAFVFDGSECAPALTELDALQDYLN